jgi:membrane protease YdiL (CAAX protease family)
MADNAGTFSEGSASQLVAPVWHTIAVVAILLALSALGARSHRAVGMRGRSHIVGYLTAASFEWLMVAFVWFGMRIQGKQYLQLVGKRWSSGRRLFVDLGLAAGFVIVSNIVLGVLGHFLKATPNSSLRGLFPQGAAESVVFLFLALTAGLCEEIIFRGYLQRQLAVLTNSSAAAILIQGIIFGAAHGYQGPKYMLIIGVYGCLFGLMAHWRRSVLPGMIAHFLQDGVLGLLAGLALKRMGLLVISLS